MRITQLRVDALRNLRAVELQPGPGINLFTGANGAGKTSLLEAVYLLSHGRSFRSGSREVLVREGGGTPVLYAEVFWNGGSLRRLGLTREGRAWRGRVDGSDVDTLATLLRGIVVVCFEPGSHALISGPSEERRSFLDWTLFHVEPRYLDIARRYRRALKQRNVLLRSSAAPDLLTPWDLELASVGTQLTAWREAFVRHWAERLARETAQLIGELGAPVVEFESGWDRSLDLAEALERNRGHDLERGHTRVGPHRADWAIWFPAAPRREYLSRGQEKACALACVLAQAAMLREALGESPVVCLDDLASELDRAHQAQVVSRLVADESQVWITGTDDLSALADHASRVTRFHVEQGQVVTLL